MRFSIVKRNLWGKLVMNLNEVVWKWLEPKINALVTRRLIAFHDALIERKQIQPSIPSGDASEVKDVNLGTEDRAA
jgi:hypothetical protein